MSGPVALLPMHSGDAVPPLDAHQVLTSWQPTAVLDLALLVSMALYVWGMVRVDRRHPRHRWPWWRGLSFAAGLATIAVSVDSVIGAYDDLLFADHMVQHLLLISVAPPLLIAGRPALLLLHASRNPLHTWSKRVLRSRVMTWLTFPLVGAGLYTAVVVGTHLSSFMSLTLTHPLVHQGEHLLYLVAGYLFFLPIIGGEPIRWKLSFPAQFALLGYAMAVDAFTGVVLMQTDYVMFPEYGAEPRDWGPSLITDLHVGGAIMWVGGDVLMTVVLLVLVAQVVRGRRSMDNPRWLEQVRVGALLGEEEAAAHPGRDVDDDEAAYQAYNRYLASLEAR